MLHVNNLSVKILKNIRLSMHTGEHLSILGANGSGKTTLARAICGLIPSDAVWIDTKPLPSLSPQERSETFHFVPAKLDLYDEYLSVQDYLALCAPEQEAAIGAVLEALGIAHLHNSRCVKLSSGESTLLMVAGAMLRRSRYTLFDEPTANLDSKNSVKLYRLLASSPLFEHRIVITHDLNLAYALGSRILYLENGEERFFGNCEEFFAPENLQRCFGGFITRTGEHFMVNYNEVH